jgi:shikimate dehydrogenase
MSDTGKNPRTPRTEADERPAQEDGVSEASAEAQIAELVEAERAAEAEERAVEEAEEAAEREEPDADDLDEAGLEGEDESDDEDDDEGDVDAVAPEVAEEIALDVEVAEEIAVERGDAEPDEDDDDTDETDDADGADDAHNDDDEPSAAPSYRLAVLGSPVTHSRSPELHAAAYRALGLDWSYEAVDVPEGELAGFIDGLGPEWRGLSLTMPLKQAVLPLLTECDRVAEQTGAANTVLFDGEEVAGFNTDVAGIVRALAGAGLTEARYVHILGGGATAASALAAVAELGAERVDVHVRDLEKSRWLEPLAHGLGLMIRLRSFSQADRSLDIPDLVISTLPGGASTEALYTDGTRRTAVLLDVAYEPWPSALASAWASVDGTVVSGLAMLVHQALLQVRIFVSGDPLEPLPDEEGVLAAMLDAAGIDAAGVPLQS